MFLEQIEEKLFKIVILILLSPSIFFFFFCFDLMLEKIRDSLLNLFYKRSRTKTQIVIAPPNRRETRRSLAEFKKRHFKAFSKQTRFQAHFIQTYRSSGSVNAALQKPLVVKPKSKTYYKERGWIKNRHLLEGYYRCNYGSFPGEVESRPGRRYRFYIYNPPPAVLSGSHSACFNKSGKNKHGDRYHIHFGVDSQNIDAGIMAIERLLQESFKHGG